MTNDATVTITLTLGNAILTHLKNGGNRLEADMLAEHLINQCNAPAIEAARQKEIQDAVAQANNAALKAESDAGLFARGPVVVTNEEMAVNPDGIDRPGVNIKRSRKGG